MLKRQLINDTKPGYRTARSFGKHVLTWLPTQRERDRYRSAGPIRFRNSITTIINAQYNRPYDSLFSLGGGIPGNISVHIVDGMLPNGLEYSRVGHSIRIRGTVLHPTETEDAETSVFEKPVNSQSYYKKFIEGQEDNSGPLYDEYYFLVKAEYKRFSITLYTVYSVFKILINTNWSDLRDIFLQQISNQTFSVDGKTDVSNEEYLQQMKNQGYFI